MLQSLKEPLEIKGGEINVGFEMSESEVWNPSKQKVKNPIWQIFVCAWQIITTDLVTLSFISCICQVLQLDQVQDKAAQLSVSIMKVKCDRKHLQTSIIHAYFY